jgi:N-acetyl-beta-hexosaminidase
MAPARILRIHMVVAITLQMTTWRFCAHAAQRRSRVIPEIEMPGHARAAVKAMEARYRHLQADDPQAADAYRFGGS